MQDKLTRIMLRELRRKSDEKKMILIKNPWQVATGKTAKSMSAEYYKMVSHEKNRMDETEMICPCDFYI